MRTPISTAVLFALLPFQSPQELLDNRRNTPVVEVVERVKPAVVSISTNVPVVRRDLFGMRYLDEQGEGPSGTGVVIYEDGFIITNFHVIEKATEIQVRFDPSDDERVYEAKRVSERPKEDLALLKIEGEGPFRTVTMCDSDPILGETVIAIGNAFGHTHTVSSGIVSGLHRNIGTNSGLVFENLIQTDASINRGNSGGPLLNVNGELIGINNAMQDTAENIGFAIPVAHVRKVLSEQLLDLAAARTWLGFDVDEETLVIQNVVPDGTADKAELKPGDRLVGLAGHLLTAPEGDLRDLYRRLRLSVQPLTKVDLEVQRGKTKKRVELLAWNLVDGILFERLGLGVAQVNIGPRGGNPFLQVTAVQENGPAGLAGCKIGDILTTLQRPNQRPRWFQRAEDLAVAISRLPAGTVVEIQLWRDLDQDQIYFEYDERSGYLEGLKGPLTLR